MANYPPVKQPTYVDIGRASEVLNERDDNPDLAPEVPATRDTGPRGRKAARIRRLRNPGYGN
ncbi:MAG TPA: hypothetical protein VFQ44_27795 [Streptosporangiaceae bacterium]|nr:hypothetical protein [Streptosporangiaceae bacterium]